MLESQGPTLQIHEVEFDEGLDIHFKSCTMQTWLVDIGGEAEPCHVMDSKKVFHVGKEEDGWLILDEQSSHIVLNKGK